MYRMKVPDQCSDRGTKQGGEGKEERRGRKVANDDGVGLVEVDAGRAESYREIRKEGVFKRVKDQHQLRYYRDVAGRSSRFCFFPASEPGTVGERMKQRARAKMTIWI
jgi:hypothetical protein